MGVRLQHHKSTRPHGTSHRSLALTKFSSRQHFNQEWSYCAVWHGLILYLLKPDNHAEAVPALVFLGCTARMKMVCKMLQRKALFCSLSMTKNYNTEKERYSCTRQRDIKVITYSAPRLFPSFTMFTTGLFQPLFSSTPLRCALILLSGKQQWCWRHEILFCWCMNIEYRSVQYNRNERYCGSERMTSLSVSP